MEGEEAEKDASTTEDKKSGTIWAAGWRPDPYKPREKSWADDSKHVKISDYHVCRNDENAYSWQIELRVIGKDYSKLWESKPDETACKVEDGSLVFTKEGEETGAYLKLPKAADPNGEIHIDCPPKGGFYVTLPKLGAKAKPAPLEPGILGTGPRNFPTNAEVGLPPSATGK